MWLSHESLRGFWLCKVHCQQCLQLPMALGVNVLDFFLKSDSFLVCPSGLDGNKGSHQDNRIILDSPAGSRQTGPRQLFPFKTDSKPLSRRLYFYIHGKGIWGVWSCKISNIIWAYPHILPTIWTSLKIYIETYWHIDLKTLKYWRRDFFIEKFHGFLHLFFSKGLRARKK